MNKFPGFVGIGSLIILLLGEIAYGQLTQGGSFVVMTIKGEVEVLRKDTKKWEPLPLDAEVSFNDKVRTRDDSLVILTSAYSIFQLEPNTEIKLIKSFKAEETTTGFAGIQTTKTNWDQELYLTKGEVFVQLNPPTEASQLKIETELGIVEVTGITSDVSFTVQHVPELKTDLTVGRGETLVIHKVRDEQINMPQGSHVLITPESLSQRRSSSNEANNLSLAAANLEKIQEDIIQAGYPTGYYTRDPVTNFREINFIQGEDTVDETATDWTEVKVITQPPITSDPIDPGISIEPLPIEPLPTDPPPTEPPPTDPLVEPEPDVEPLAPDPDPAPPAPAPDPEPPAPDPEPEPDPEPPAPDPEPEPDPEPAPDPDAIWDPHHAGHHTQKDHHSDKTHKFDEQGGTPGHLKHKETFAHTHPTGNTDAVEKDTSLKVSTIYLKKYQRGSHKKHIEKYQDLNRQKALQATQKKSIKKSSVTTSIQKSTSTSKGKSSIKRSQNKAKGKSVQTSSSKPKSASASVKKAQKNKAKSSPSQSQRDKPKKPKKK